MVKITKRHLKNGLTYFLSGLITLVFIEIGSRVVFYNKDSKVLSQLEKYAEPPHPTQNSPLGDLIRLNENPKIIYEWKPNISAIFKNKTIRINKNGFRGKLIPLKKGKKTVRIMGLGDSVMFGWGVGEEENFMEVLKTRLAASYPSCDWEVVNTAVPGYTTWMEVATLEEKGLAYKPDLVIISFVSNDLLLPSFIAEQVNYFTLSSSFIYDYFRTKKMPHEDVPQNHKDRFRANRPYTRQAPKEYRGLEGIEAYKEAMIRLRELSEQYGFEVMIMGSKSHKQPPGIAEIWDELGIALIGAKEVEWDTYVEKHQIDKPETAWKLSKTDHHPSVIGHQFTAEVIFNRLSEGMVESLCQP